MNKIKYNLNKKKFEMVILLVMLSVAFDAISYQNVSINNINVKIEENKIRRCRYNTFYAVCP